MTKQMDLEGGKQIIRNRFQNGRVAVFIGAGASEALGIPTWEKLLKDMVEYFSLQKLIDIEKVLKNTKLSKIASLIYECIGDDKYKNYLHEKFKPKKHSYTSLGIKICRAFDLMLTVNYDACLESAYHEIESLQGPDSKGKKELIIQRLPDFSQEIIDNTKTIVYLHGNNDTKQYLLREEDYKIFYPKNYENDKYSDLEIYLHHIFTKYCVIFLGFSFKDEDFFKCYERIMKTYPVQRKLEFSSLGGVDQYQLPQHFVLMDEESYFYKIDDAKVKKYLKMYPDSTKEVFDKLSDGFFIFSDEEKIINGNGFHCIDGLQEEYAAAKNKEKLRYLKKDLCLQVILYKNHVELDGFLDYLIQKECIIQDAANSVEGERYAK